MAGDHDDADMTKQGGQSPAGNQEGDGVATEQQADRDTANQQQERPPGDQADGAPSVNQQVNVSVEHQDSSQSLLVRGVYFVLIGWWASGIWLGIAWLLNLTIVLMPVGIRMINKIPKIVSLKDRKIESEVVSEDGDVTIKQSNKDQYSLLIRGAYFLLVGWWVSGIWMSIAWALSITIIGIPLAMWMYDRLPFIVSLYRY